MTVITRHRAAMVMLAGVLTTGCLLKRDTHTWYLEPGSGEVSWVVSEQDVRSDAAAAADRQNEELTWWNAVQAGNHAIARGLRRLGAPDVEIHVLRSRAPFHVVTEGTFRSIDELGQQIILMAGLSGTSTLTRDGDRLTWTMSARDPHAADNTLDEDVSALLGSLSDLRVVLNHGRFESAHGFTLEQDRRVAAFEDPDDDDEVVTLQLVWTVTNAHNVAGADRSGR